MRYPSPRKLTESERAAQIDLMLAAGVDDVSMANAWPVPRKPRKTVTPKPRPWESPEFIKSWHYMAVIFDLKDAVEKRDFERFKEYQAKIEADFGLRIELSGDCQEKWPASPPEPVPAVERKELDTMPVVPSSELS
jgi:hypothetical protein